MAQTTSRSAVEGTVTLLFTDLVGSTELLSRIGDEAAEGVRRAHFRLLRDAVTARGGQEVKNLGDGLMVAFPSAADAVRCAVDMQQAVGRHNLRAGEALSVRVGLHVGEPVRDENDYFGTPVVVAQRLCNAASGGQIIASDLVRVLVGSAAGLEYLDLEPIELKGLSEPVAACAVVWDPTPGPLSLPPSLSPDSGLFVNRTEEVARLRALWDKARGGERQLAFVVGEPGIGKTRLAAEIAQTVRVSGLALYGRSDEETLVPYQPFVEALRPYLLSLPDKVLADELAVDGAHIARLMPEVAERLAHVTGPPAAGSSDDPATERYRLFEAMTAVLDHAATAAPVFLVLDDMHWADKPTVLLLRHIIRSPRPQRLFILGTYRDTEVGPERPLGGALADLRRDHRYDRLRLHGLSAEDVVALTGEWGDAALAEVVGGALYAETEGNPFFVGETLRHLAESGAIHLEDGRWTADAGAAEFAIPEGVREVVTRRLARLTEEARRILSIAAVMGPEFELRPLASVVERDESAVLDALDAGVGAQVIVESPDAVDRYQFSHALIRRTLHDEMSTTRRVRLHLRIAEAIEARTDGPSDRRLAQLAYHFGEAAVAGQADKAATYAEAAGARALELVSYEEAVEHFKSAVLVLDLAIEDGQPDAEARRNEALLALGDAEWRTGDVAAAQQTFAAAADTALRTGNVDQLARAALGYGCGLGGYGQTVRADTTLIALLEQALEAVGSQPTALRARLLGRLATELYYTPEADRRSALAAEAVEMARALDDPAVLGVALISCEAATWGPDRPPIERLAACDEIIALSQQSGDRHLALEARSLRIDALIVLGDIAAADEEHRLRSREAEALRIPQYLTDVFTYPAARALLAGDFGEAQRLADHTVAVADPLYTETTVTLFGAQVICLHWLRGELDGLAPMVRDFADRYPWIPAFRATEAFVLAETGDLDGARAAVAALAPDKFAAIPRDGIWTIGMWTLVGAVARVPDKAWATDLYALIQPVADCSMALGASMYLGPAGTSLGTLARVLGRFGEGAAHFEHALTDVRRIGARPFEALASHQYALLLRERADPGDEAQAVQLATTARAIAENLGMAGLLKDLAVIR
ncbi:MAG: AAA family ATPase [Actinobacteria bacterium]|nr:AAA family ATPase [Actinomycetota bacterium]